MTTGPRHRLVPRAALIVGVLCLVCAACSPPVAPRTTRVWLVGRGEPPFDPTGPPDPTRWALERLLGEGLVSEDSAGVPGPGAARRCDVTGDSLTYTFTLRPGLGFDDGRRCTAEDFCRALGAGLNRLDHALYTWLLAPIVGVERVRAGRPLPVLGIAAPNESTVVVRLARRDPAFLHKLAIPGVSMPWAPDLDWSGGIGRYRLVARDPGRRMVLARREPGAEPDTLRIDFGLAAPGVRGHLRRGGADLVWPVPPSLITQPFSPDYRTRALDAHPPRWLWLVMRADRPPTLKIEARRALAHGLRRTGIASSLDPYHGREGEWPPGGGEFDFPRWDAREVRAWLDRGKLGRSLHVVMAYAADGVAAEVAPAMQTGWAEQGLDVELRPLRGAAFTAEALGRRGAQLLLIEAQSPLDDPVSELSMVIDPRRGPPVGAFRSGWSNADFARWLAPSGPPLDVGFARRRLEEDLVALPLARLPWVWVERAGGAPNGADPRFGPDPCGAAPDSLVPMGSDSTQSR